VAVVYRKLVLLEFERLLTNSAIIPLKLQKKIKIGRG
jgi:hypothetical protein